jgi:hypothetical protein
VKNEERDPLGKDRHAPGAKLDAGKIRPWLMLSGFARALTAVADVTTKGAAKYTPSGWAEVPDGETRYMEAFGRHLLSYGKGEKVDADTSCLHKAQMIWNLLASLELELREAEEWVATPTGLEIKSLQQPDSEGLTSPDMPAAITSCCAFAAWKKANPLTLWTFDQRNRTAVASTDPRGAQRHMCNSCWYIEATAGPAASASSDQ